MTKISINLKSKIVAEHLVEYLNNIFGKVCIYGYIPDCDYLITEENMDTYNLPLDNLVILININHTNNHQHQQDKTSLLYYPFNISQLVNLVNILINRRQNVITLKHLQLIYSFNTGQIKNEVKNLSVKLTDKETLLLQSLFNVYPQAISKAELLKKIWYIENSEIETFTLESHISFLRKKLANYFPEVSIIKEPKGYRLAINDE